MANYILVKVDVNDGDYVSEFSPISDHDIKVLKPLIEKIKSTPDSNFPNGCIFDPSDDNRKVYEMYAERDSEGNPVDQDAAIETLFQYAPVPDNGFHSIVTIEIYDVGHIDLLYHKYA